MADIQTLKGKITSTIYPNGKGAINAADHQALLLDVADTIADVQDGVSELSQTTDAKLTQLETTTNTKLTELSAEISNISESNRILSESVADLTGKVNSSELNSGSYQQAVERSNEFPGVFVWFLNQSGIKKPIWHVGDGVFVDAAGAIVELEPESAFRYTVILTQDNDTVIIPTAAGKVYDMIVDWGDGNEQQVSGVISRNSVTHTYTGTAGTKYQITLRGVVPGLLFGATAYGVPSQLYSIDDNSIQNVIMFGVNQKTDFKDCVNLTSLSSNALHNAQDKSILTFESCSSLKTLPNGVLDGFELTTASCLFAGCTSLVLSEDFMNSLAQKISGATSFFYAFQGCKGKIHIPDNFFDNVESGVTDVRQMTQNSTGVTGDAKQLYDSLKTKMITEKVVGCFSGANLSNRDQVPSSWGGTM